MTRKPLPSRQGKSWTDSALKTSKAVTTTETWTRPTVLRSTGTKQRLTWRLSASMASQMRCKDPKTWGCSCTRRKMTTSANCWTSSIQLSASCCEHTICSHSTDKRSSCSTENKKSLRNMSSRRRWPLWARSKASSRLKHRSQWSSKVCFRCRKGLENLTIRTTSLNWKRPVRSKIGKSKDWQRRTRS